MKTQFNLTSVPQDFADFMPAEGTWSHEDGNHFEAVRDIQRRLHADHGFPVKVELFDERGHAFTSDCKGGQMVVTRATSREIKAMQRA